MKLARAMVTVAGLTGMSRIFGFVRDVLTAAVLGAGPIADAFFVALKLPNFFRRVTAEGAFSVAFVPLYSEAVEKDGREAADAFAGNAFMVMLSILSVVVLLALAGMPYIIAMIAPGFSGDSVRFDAAVELSRVTFPYLLLMSLTALLGGVLNALDRFAPFAFAPVLFNVCSIAALLLAGQFESAGHALSYGVLLAGVAQLVWLIVAARRAGVRLRLKLPRINADIKKVFALMGPGVIGAGVMHINLFADMVIASFLGEGSISYLYYADRLNQLPLGVVGIAVGTALLPMLSKAVAGADKDKAADLFNRAMEYCFLLALPAALALGVFAELIIGVLFERGAFDAAVTSVTAGVLTAYALGLPAYIAIKVFSTVHWAHKDTKTPVKIAVVATLVNIALSLVLIRYIGVAGIALATGVTGWLSFGMHMRALKGRDGFGFDRRFKVAFLKIIASSVGMVLACYFVFASMGGMT
jgi:putative peptidoglycan lipid II flippase